ncbi:hypothetical protein F2P81_017567 [Scophthalmus maximus]|uniref:Uncharacterized protein n=1 Tax=Scophthalmus maximus TaxID=52904 RepID=A0A6A4S6I6_SCOMX|nr:hypothetical protein F2P81_017567 [Scophthalmus maximus]
MKQERLLGDSSIMPPPLLWPAVPSEERCTVTVTFGSFWTRKMVPPTPVPPPPLHRPPPTHTHTLPPPPPPPPSRPADLDATSNSYEKNECAARMKKKKKKKPPHEAPEVHRIKLCIFDTVSIFCSSGGC